MTDRLYYAYGVLAADEPTAVAGVVGVGGAGVSMLSGRKLAVAASPVPAEDFEERSLDRRLEDPDWTSQLAMSHFRTVAELHARVPVLPLRMCTVYRSAEGAVATVEANSAPLEEALARVAGCSEWSVSVRGGGDPDPAADRVAEATSGAEYLRQVASRGRQREAAVEEALEAARRLHRGLSELAVAIDPTGATAGAEVRQTYLVHQRDTPRFLDALQHSEVQRPRLEVDVRGPWAPYSFVPVLREAA